MRDGTTTVLVVAEGLHPGAHADVERLVADLGTAIAATWGATPRTAVLTTASPSFEI